MIANYHTHTYRCSHATGTEEEYINNAINLGLSHLGFSDHAPFSYKNGFESGYRVPTALATEYIATLNKLKEKYKNKIQIHIGFEMEYYPDYFNEMLKFVKTIGAEYLILGQHFINHDRDGIPHSCGSGHTAEELIHYTDRVISGIKTGKFSYVAHPDVFLFEDDDEIYRREALRLCAASKEFNVPLEINFLGILENRHYPNPKFMEIAGQVGCKMIYGIDAHSQDWSYYNFVFSRAQDIVKKYNLNLINNLELKKL